MRRAALANDEHAEAIWVCAACGHPVFPSEHPRTRRRHFRHRGGAPDSCPWQNNAWHISELDTLRFGGLGEGPLHRALKGFIRHMANEDPRFAPPDVPNFDPFREHRITTAEGWRQPDVFRTYEGTPIAFEVQLASTYIKAIAGREDFYERLGIKLVWVFWRFEDSNHLLPIRDIVHLNRSNAVSLDLETIELSIDRQRLHVRAWWWDFVPDRPDERHWVSSVVDFGELRWDASTLKPFLVDPLEGHTRLLAKRLLDVWRNPPWLGDGDLDLTTYSASAKSAYEALARASECEMRWNEARIYSLHRFIPQLAAISEGQGEGNMNLKSTVMNLLENWRWGTHVIVAVLRNYGLSDWLADYVQAARKIRRNIREAYQGVPESIPERRFDRLLCALFPKAEADLMKPWPKPESVERLRRR